MESQSAALHFGGNAGNNLLPVSAFSAYSLLRNCNYLLSSQSTDLSPKSLHSPRVSTNCPLQSPVLKDDLSARNCLDSEKPFMNLVPHKSFLPAPLLAYPHSLNMIQNDHLNSRSTTVVSPCSFLYANNLKRQRGEKKPIPDEQKDDKYYERRRRNNYAAKKSRDARKMREDQIALRATILEHENALLRAQVLTLREEASSLRQILLQKKAHELATR